MFVKKSINRFLLSDGKSVCKVGCKVCSCLSMRYRKTTLLETAEPMNVHTIVAVYHADMQRSVEIDL